MAKRSFIPRDKPKSWVLMMIGILVALIIGAPIIWLGDYLDFRFVEVAGFAIFYLGWLLGISMSIVFAYGSLSGKYGRLETRNWSAQVW